MGFDEGGQLTKAVRQRPYSVVLFDEIEKAHPDMFNILLQILEEGRLTDAQGRTVDFRNTVIIMTSTSAPARFPRPPRSASAPRARPAFPTKEIRSRVMGEVKKLFRPEFLNRIDEIIVFKSLTQEQIVEIAKLMVADLRERLIAQNMTINLTDDDAYKLIAKGRHRCRLRRRPLRRAISAAGDPLSGRAARGQVDGIGHPGKRFRGWREPCVRPRHGSIPAPRKHDNIARDAELLLTNFDLGHAGVSGSGGSASGGAGGLRFCSRCALPGPVESPSHALFFP